jgi:hypothetical protein
VVVDLLDARDIFRRDNGCLTGIIAYDDAHEARDSVANRDVEPARAPGSLPDRRDDFAANMVVIRGWARNIAGEVGEHGKKIRARHNSDKTVSPHNGKAFDVIGLHDLCDPIERRILGDGDGIRRHDLADLSAMLFHEFGRGFVCADQESQPPAALSLGSDLRPAIKSPSEIMPINSPAASTTGSPPTWCRSIVSMASTMEASAPIVIACAVMIWSARMDASKSGISSYSV